MPEPELTDAEIQAILQRAEAATPGPWDRDRREVQTEKGGHLCDFTKWEDAAFAADARSDVPRLCRALLAERKERDRLRERLKQMQKALALALLEPAPEAGDKEG